MADEPQSVPDRSQDATTMDTSAGQETSQNEKETTMDQAPSEAEDVQPVKKTKLCGVCEKAEAKYKCPRCYLP